MIRAILTIVILSAISGCATSPFGTAGAGGAVYRYSNTSDGGCSIEISSSRELVGVSVQVQDCDVTVSADKTDGAKAMDVIDSLVKRLP